MQANISQMKLDIAILHEQKSSQLEKLDILKADSKNREISDAIVISKYRDQLSCQESDSKRTVNALERRADEAEHKIAEANRSIQELQSEINRRSLEAKILTTAHKEEIDSLQARIREQEAVVKDLTQRASTISKRYKEGDLVSGSIRGVNLPTHRKGLERY